MSKRRRMIGMGVSVLAVVLAAGASVFFFWLPSYLERTLNHTIPHAQFQISDDARKLHDSLSVADLHSDTLLWDRDILARSRQGHVDVPRLVEGGVALQVFTAVTQSPKNQNYRSNSADTDQITMLAIAERYPVRAWSSTYQRALYQAAKLHDAASRSDGTFTVVTTAPELKAFRERHESNPDTVAGILGIEGAQCLEGKLDNLQGLYDAGYRTVGLTHFFDNAVGGSAHGIEKGGLTDFGREVLAKVEERHMIVDLAHASPALIDDVLDAATRPVIYSHGGLQGYFDSVRNLSDAQAKRIAGDGGLIGIGYWDTAIDGEDPASLGRAIQYAVDLLGADHVALGSDFDGATTVPFDASELAVVTQALVNEGLPDEAIRKIMGGNVLDFFARNLPGA